MKKNKGKNIENQIESSNETKKSKLTTFFASLALFIGSMIAAFKVVPKISNKLYKNSVKKSNRLKDEEDWGPVIEKKTKK